jgi:hypothetical protein
MDILRIYKRSIKYRNRRIANRIILMGMKNNFEINEVGNFIWEHLDGNTNLSSIINLLVQEYDSSKDIIQIDAVNFINFLYENKIIEEV